MWQAHDYFNQLVTGLDYLHSKGLAVEPFGFTLGDLGPFWGPRPFLEDLGPLLKSHVPQRTFYIIWRPFYSKAPFSLPVGELIIESQNA